MNQDQPACTQSLISQPDVCKKLGKTHSGLAKLKAKDSTFPKPIKFSEARQAAAYYVAAEVEAWLQTKIQARDAA